MTQSQVNLEAFPSFSELQSLLSKRFALDPEAAAVAQPEFELALRERMRQLECDFHKADFERLDVEVAGVVADGKRFRFKKKLMGATPR